MKQHIHNGQLVTGLMEAVGSGKRNLKSIPMLVKRIISDGMWAEFYVDRTKQLVTRDSFIEFVTKKPMEGLGIDLDLLKRICRDDAEAIRLIGEVTTGEHGGNHGNQYTGGKTDIISLATSQHGTSRQYALRKLHKGRPDLHAQVLAKKLSPHAAMIEAGYRVKSMTIPADPTRAAQYLKRRFTKTEFDAFKKELLT